jgi:hypothetical protein
MTFTRFIPVPMLALVVSCSTVDDVHRNFLHVIQSDVGMSINYRDILWNRYPESRRGIRMLENGNNELQYAWRQSKECMVYFEVDKASERIVAFRFEGTKTSCAHNR